MAAAQHPQPFKSRGLSDAFAQMAPNQMLAPFSIHKELKGSDARYGTELGKRKA